VIGHTAIREAVAMLSNAHRALIYRAYYLELSTVQIAAEYQIAESAVRVELHDAMVALQRAVASTGQTGRSQFLAH
jgi:RNA polymerase sigma-70 factor (ECF subfamily)